MGHLAFTVSVERAAAHHLTSTGERSEMGPREVPHPALGQKMSSWAQGSLVRALVPSHRELPRAMPSQGLGCPVFSESGIGWDHTAFAENAN